MRVLRRLVPELGLLTIAGFAWNHRGTLVRSVELVADVPRILREGGAGGLVRHGRELYELDRAVPTDMSVRLRHAPLLNP